MKKSKFTEEQIAFALRQAEAGTRVIEVCRKMGISEQTFFRWKKKYGGLGVSELRRLFTPPIYAIWKWRYEMKHGTVDSDQIPLPHLRGH